MGGPATSWDEQPFFVPAGNEDLFGVLTRPTVEPRGMAVLLLWGSGQQPSFGRNRIRARLARRLAASGYHCVRLDYHGAGESSGDVPEYDLDRPFTEDLEAVLQWLVAQGLTRVIPVATCFGALTALALSEQIQGLCGMVVLSAPLRDRDLHSEPPADPTDGYDRDEAQGESPPPQLVERIEELLSRRTPMLLVHGTGDGNYPLFQRVRLRLAAKGLDEAGGVATVRVIDERVHGFPSISVQEEVMDLVEAWLWQVDSARPLGHQGSEVS